MKLTKKQFDIKKGIQKEWLITNGIGGYASSTVIGANTRKYHGLLVAPLEPPAQRHVILSKLDESILVENEKIDLYTNLCKNYISEGYKHQESFEKQAYPEFIYKVKNVKMTKKVCMVYGQNSVVINYVIKNDNSTDIKMTIAPIMNFRDFHAMTTNHEFDIKQEISDTIKIQIDGNLPVFLKCEDATYIQHFHDIFRNMYYLKEEERGFFPEEDLCIPGRFEVTIPAKKKKEVSVVVSLNAEIENIDTKKVFENETQRVEAIVKATKLVSSKANLTKEEKDRNEFLKDLILATDNFVIERPKFDLHSILAGFPWFLDWGRDTAISFEGLLLITKRYDLAREILLTLVRDIKCGLVPNGYSESDSTPLYNSADASLLLFEQINRFVKYTKDYEFIKQNIYEKLKMIIQNYTNGIDLDDNNIYIDHDGLLVSGTPNTQNTWMDAKIGDYAVTPRNGKVVELNSLWYNALKTLENFAKKFDEKDLAEECKNRAKAHKKVFEEKFYNADKKSLYDVLGDDKIRPNQLFSIGTTYPIIAPASDMGKTIFETAKKKLLTKYGLRTLAQGEEGYIAEYCGDSYKRDMSYHQGIAWVWLLGLYADSLDNIIDSEKDRIEKEKYIIEKEKLMQNVYQTFQKELYGNECVGSISEVYDSMPPYKPGGTCAQAWSVAEILRIVSKMES